MFIFTHCSIEKRFNYQDKKTKNHQNTFISSFLSAGESVTPPLNSKMFLRTFSKFLAAATLRKMLNHISIQGKTKVSTSNVSNSVSNIMFL